MIELDSINNLCSSVFQGHLCPSVVPKFLSKKQEYEKQQYSAAKLQSKKKFRNRRCTQINADRENVWSLVYLIETTNIILHRQNLIKKSIFSRKIKKSYLALMLILRILWPSLVQSIHLRAFACICGSKKILVKKQDFDYE